MSEGEFITVEMPPGFFSTEQLEYFGVTDPEGWASFGDVFVVHGDGSGVLKMEQSEAS